MKKDKRVNTDKIKKRDNIFTIILSFCDVIAITVLFLLYGPYANFRDWLITTAMGTMNHQYLATWFLSDEEIQHIKSNCINGIKGLLKPSIFGNN